jgi:uncharacterized damage-inducible protein DinB
MPRKRSVDPTIAHAEHLLKDVYLPRILYCLDQLQREQIWWRPNESSNSVGNLVLHLTGNVRQWITSGLGRSPDSRQRDKEFSERRHLQRRPLAAGLQSTVQDACRVLRSLNANDLHRLYTIQKFQVTGLEAVFHVAEHFSHHAGQIILIAKMLTGRDLKFTQLPAEGKIRSKKLPAW